MARLTDRSIEALRPMAARYEVWDDARKGGGVRVTPRGVKSSVWVYHFDGRPRQLTFGTYPRLSLAVISRISQKGLNILIFLPIEIARFAKCSCWRPRARVA